MTTNIYLIRHGEVHNPKEIIYGRLTNFGLSKKGELQITNTAKFLQDKNISAIYSSPLLRARQTAIIIKNILSLPNVSIIKDLLEVKTSIEGLKKDTLDLMNLDYFSPPTWKLTDDTMEQVADRMNRAIQKLFKKNKGKSVVAISHGDPIMIIKASINRSPLNISSIRPINYLGHGEVMHVQQINKEPITMKSVFIPKL